MTKKTKIIINIEIDNDENTSYTINYKGDIILNNRDLINFFDYIKNNMIDDYENQIEILKEKLNRLENPDDYEDITP